MSAPGAPERLGLIDTLSSRSRRALSDLGIKADPELFDFLATDGWQRTFARAPLVGRSALNELRLLIGAEPYFTDTEFRRATR